MTESHVTVIRGEPPVTVDDARVLLRTLAEVGGDRRGADPFASDRPRTWAVIGELEPGADTGPDENDVAVAHDRVGRLAVRLAVDKTLCVGPSRAVRALHQGAVMEGSWGDEARLVETIGQARDLPRVDPDWRPAPGDVILIAAASAEVVGVVEAWADDLRFRIRDHARPPEHARAPQADEGALPQADEGTDK